MKINKYIRYIASFVLILTFAAGCEPIIEEDEEPANVYEKIKGTWTISKISILGAEIPGEGSTLTFEYCDEPPCIGQDYKASDDTKGTFTYQFVKNDSEIIIIDDNSHGGNYNTTWSVLDFESSKLRMTGDFSIFGSMLLEMYK